MRILLVTDIHGDAETLEKILEKEDFEAVLVGGDIGDANDYDDYERNLLEVLEVLNEKGELVKAVPGNMDMERTCVKELIDHRMNIHRKIASISSFEVVGFGGGETPFDTFFEPEGSEIKDTLEELYGRMSSDTRVAVVHQTPGDTELDIVDGKHAGSDEVRELFEEKDFDLLLTGHIHESYGIDEVNGTTMVNPGAVLDGRYGVAEITEEGIEVELGQI